MKNEKTPWSSLVLLIGVAIAIMALVRGKMQTWLLLAAFALWGIWVAVFLFAPRIKRYRRKKALKKQAKQRKSEEISSTEMFQLTAMNGSSAEQLLLRHVNHRISAYLRSAYPDMTWEWACVRKNVR